MRKSKFVLGAVVALGILGAAFAFKAKQSQFVYVPAPGAPTLCTVTSFGFTAIDNGNDPLTITAQTTTTRPCTLLTVYPGL